VGIPATGRKANWTVIIIGRFEGEKLAEDWVEYDRYNLFRRLGSGQSDCKVAPAIQDDERS
jgi:predicted ester cyclase